MPFPLAAVLGRLAIALAVTTVIISCASTPKPEYTPSAATAALQKTLGPSDTALECLRNKFNESPEIATIFNVEDKATAEQRDGYLRAIRSCIPIGDFAALISTATVEAVETGTTQITSDDKARCVRDVVVGLSPAEQDRLYLYFSNPGAINANEIAPTTRAMSDACGLGDR